jgi:uncharacterized protein involved in exopolysaccharide biosynthesis
MLRLLESFFRRWYFYLVPLVLLCVVGVLNVAGTKKAYQSLGTFNVENSTVLSTLSGTGDANSGFDTAASSTSKRIGALLQTDQFIKDVSVKAHLDGAVAAGQITLGQIRASITAWPNGSNLVNVSGTNANPAVAQALAGATIDAFVQGTIDSQASQSDAAVAFFSQLVTSYQGDVTKAQTALDKFLAAHPAPAVGSRPDDEQAQLARLNADLTAAQARYDEAVSKNQDAQLSTEKTKADVGQRLRVVDAPQVPTVPLGGLKTSITNFATFAVLGVLLTGGALVVGTLLDRTIRTPNDVSRLGIRLLTVVPAAGSHHGGRAPVVKPPRSPAKEKKPKSLADARPQVRTAKPQAVPATAARGTPATGQRRQPHARPATKAGGGSSWPN